MVRVRVIMIESCDMSENEMNTHNWKHRLESNIVVFHCDDTKILVANVALFHCAPNAHYSIHI